MFSWMYDKNSLECKESKIKYLKTIINVLLFIILIFFNSWNWNEKSIIVVSIFIVTISNLMSERIRNSNINSIWLKPSKKILLYLCSILVSFLFFGDVLFVSAEKITIINFLYWGVYTYICIPVIKFLMWAISEIGYCITIKSGQKRIKALYFAMISFGIMFFVLLIISFGYFPGNMTSDGIYQWIEGMGEATLLDDHPALHTIFLGICYRIYPSIYTAVIIHIILFCLIWSAFFTFLYRKNINGILLFFMSMLLAMSTNNYMMLTLVSKNTLYAIIVLWNTYILIKMIDDSENFWNNLINIFIYPFAISLQHIIRHNGFGATILVFIGLAIWGVFHKKYLLKISYVFLASIMIILFIKGPLYNCLNVVKPDISTAKTGVLMEPVGMFLQAGAEIPEEVADEVYKIGNKEDWISIYNPYNGDRLVWGKLREGINNLPEDEAFKIYLTLLKENPWLVMKARLTATDIMWNVFEPSSTYEKYGVNKARYMIGVYCTEFDFVSQYMKKEVTTERDMGNGIYFKENIFTKLGTWGNKVCDIPVIDALLYRNGIWLALMVILFFYLVLTAQYEKVLIAFPEVAIVGTLALAASWQVYQYYWFFNICSLMMLWYIIVNQRGYIKMKLSTDKTE